MSEQVIDAVAVRMQAKREYREQVFSAAESMADLFFSSASYPQCEAARKIVADQLTKAEQSMLFGAQEMQSLAIVAAFIINDSEPENG